MDKYAFTIDKIIKTLFTYASEKNVFKNTRVKIRTKRRKKENKEERLNKEELGNYANMDVVRRLKKFYHLQ